MRHEIQNWGKATLILSTNCDGRAVADDDGGPGSGTWTFRREDLRRLRLRDYCEESGNSFGDIRRSSTSLAQDLRSNGYDEPGEDEIRVSDPDTAIRLLAIMRRHGGTFEVSHESEGSEYWAWHDIGHAEHDCEIGSVWRKGQTGTYGKQSDRRRAAQIYVDGEAESRALVRGAREAIRRHVDAGEVLRELAQAEGAFRERFKYECDAVSSFLAGCVLTLRDMGDR